MKTRRERSSSKRVLSGIVNMKINELTLGCKSRQQAASAGGEDLLSPVWPFQISGVAAPSAAPTDLHHHRIPLASRSSPSHQSDLGWRLKSGRGGGLPDPRCNRPPGGQPTFVVNFLLSALKS